MKTLELYTDGGSRGNPGPAGIGAVVKTLDGEVVDTVSRYIGKDTNNVAEYTALIEGLKACQEQGGTEIRVYMDSELIVKQIKREYKVKNENLAKLFVQVWNLIQTFQKVNFEHIPRERNKEADALVNEALDRWQNT